MKANVKIGVLEPVETSPGYNEEIETVRNYKVDIYDSYRRWNSNDQINDSMRFDCKIKLIPDSYFRRMPLGYFKWVEIHGTKWKINSISITDGRSYVLTIGGVWNG